MVFSSNRITVRQIMGQQQLSFHSKTVSSEIKRGTPYDVSNLYKLTVTRYIGSVITYVVT